MTISETAGLDHKKIMLGMSGGVDSTTAALLLLQKGFEVHGFYFNIHAEGDGERAAAFLALQEAYRAAGYSLTEQELAARFHYRDAAQRFRDIVIADFCREYKQGRTPNPCVLCNPTVKFHLLREAADETGAFWLATGHYAQVQYDEDRSVYFIAAIDSRKDQSYMLYRLPQEILARLMLPLAEITTKEETRQIAREHRLSSAEASDSQELCFIEDGADRVTLICQVSGDAGIAPGNFIDRQGTVLGRHKGLAYYTVGQRKGLGIALGKPAFVTAIDAESNTVMLDTEEGVLWQSEVSACDLFFTETGGSTLPEGLSSAKLTAKVRYAAPRAAVESAELLCEETTARSPGGAGAETALRPADPLLRVVFREPQRAMTPGQSLVLYDGDRVIGGGRIWQAR